MLLPFSDQNCQQLDYQKLLKSLQNVMENKENKACGYYAVWQCQTLNKFTLNFNSHLLFAKDT